MGGREEHTQSQTKKKGGERAEDDKTDVEEKEKCMIGTTYE